MESNGKAFIWYCATAIVAILCLTALAIASEFLKNRGESGWQECVEIMGYEQPRQEYRPD